MFYYFALDWRLLANWICRSSSCVSCTIRNCRSIGCRTCVGHGHLLLRLRRVIIINCTRSVLIGIDWFTIILNCLRLICFVVLSDSTEEHVFHDVPENVLGLLLGLLFLESLSFCLWLFFLVCLLVWLFFLFLVSIEQLCLLLVRFLQSLLALFVIQLDRIGCR